MGGVLGAQREAAGRHAAPKRGGSVQAQTQVGERQRQVEASPPRPLGVNEKRTRGAAGQARVAVAVTRVLIVQKRAHEACPARSRMERRLRLPGSVQRVLEAHGRRGVGGRRGVFARGRRAHLQAAERQREPMFEGYAPSRMHFYRSVLAFHDAFRHKRWEALVDHIRANFTTTMSMPNAATPGYRGWYRKDNNIAI